MDNKHVRTASVRRPAMAFLHAAPLLMVIASLALVATLAGRLTRPAHAAAAFDCTSGNSVYVLNDTNQASIYQVDVTTGTSTLVGSDSLNVGNLATNSYNDLGIAPGGTNAYLIDPGGHVDGYSTATGTFSDLGAGAAGTASGTPQAGAVDPANGIYYYGFTILPPTIYAYDPSTSTSIGKVGTLTGTTGGSGDMAFDLAGNGYLLSGSNLYRFTPPSPVAGNQSILLTLLNPNVSGSQPDGIVFGGDGYLYTTSAGDSHLYRYNPTTGAASGTISISGNLQGITDAAGCVFPYTLAVNKAIVGGRAFPGDQFTVTESGSGLPAAATATTTGTGTTATGTAGPYLVLPSNQYTVTEAPANGAVRANYTSSWSCIDSLNSNAVIASGTGTTGTFTYGTAVSPQGRDVVCTFTNAAIPAVTVQKALGSVRIIDTDQFQVELRSGSVTGPILSSGATTGTGQTVSGGTAARTLLTPGSSYVVTESALGTTSLAKYAATITCTDANGVQAGLPTGQPLNPAVGLAFTPVVGAAVSCTITNTALPASLVVTKSVTPASGSTVKPGDTLTYKVTFDNSGGGLAAAVDEEDDLTAVLDDAAFGAITSTGGLTVTGPDPTTHRLHITGSVAGGQSTAITYTVTVSNPDTGNHELDNYAVPTGSAPPTSCVPTDKTCTENPVLSISKTVSPASGTTVQPGQTLTYTLTFSNVTGSTAATVDEVDDLSRALDDASFGSVTAAGGLTVGPLNTTTGKLPITGSVPAGQSAVVTYTIKVDSPDVGDHELDNFLVGPGVAPPTTCLPADSTCTTNPVLAITKTGSPASGATVQPGQLLTYTLTFSNHAGTSAATVSQTDDLSKVLDDATFGSVTANGGLTVGPLNAGKLPIAGAVPPGGTAVVTYTVTVDSPDLGDHSLDNYLVPTGSSPPATCLAADPTCTTNPVLTVTKSGNPASGTTVVPGQTITYTLTFSNSAGTSAAAVNQTDDLGAALDDAAVTTAPTLASGAGLVIGAVSSGRFTITGSLAAGARATVTYKLTVASPDLGDHELDNYLVSSGSTPPSSCLPADPACTTNPVLVITKAGNPTSGTTVQPGQAITYTLTFSNAAGTSAATVAQTDDLSKDLDDAVVTTQPRLTGGPGLTLGAITNGKLTLTGTLAAGATAIVTYTVTVDTPDLGDHELDNYLVPTGTTPPTTCVAGDPTCTKNPVLTVTKSVSPASRTVVSQGQALSYTLTVSNASGQSAATVSQTDDLADALDDAAVTTQPKLATGSGLTVSAVAAGTFTITGSLAAGASATVTYQLTVASPDPGDHVLSNYVVLTGTNPPTTCATTDPTCTTNTVPPNPSCSSSCGSDAPASLDAIKVLATANGQVASPSTAVYGGETLVYRITVSNSGGTSGSTTLSDTVPASTRYAGTGGGWSCVAGAVSGTACTQTVTVAAGASVSVNYTVTIIAPLPTGTATVANQLTSSSGTCSSCNPSNPTSFPKLTIVKKAGTPIDVNGDGVTDAGDTIAYTFEVTNTGGVALTVITVHDSRLSTVTCPQPSLSPGATETCVGAKYTVTAADVIAGSVRNTATATGIGPDGVTITSPPSTARVDTGTPKPDAHASLALVKKAHAVDANNDGVTDAGDTITYTFQVTNTGNVTITDITIRDARLTGLTCPKPTLLPGLSETCTGDPYAISAADGATGRVKNTATVVGGVKTCLKADGTAAQRCPAVNSAPAGVVVATRPSRTGALRLRKLAHPRDTNGDGTIDAGDEITYSFDVTNIGAATVTAVVIADGKLGAVSCPQATLAPGASEICTGDDAHVITAADGKTGKVTNIAVASGKGPSGAAITSNRASAVVPVVNPGIEPNHPGQIITDLGSPTGLPTVHRESPLTLWALVVGLCSLLLSGGLIRQARRS